LIIYITLLRAGDKEQKAQEPADTSNSPHQTERFADSHRFGQHLIKYEKFIMERYQGGSSRDLGAKKVIERVRAFDC